MYTFIYWYINCHQSCPLICPQVYSNKSWQMTGV